MPARNSNNGTQATVATPAITETSVNQTASPLPDTTPVISPVTAQTPESQLAQATRNTALGKTNIDYKSVSSSDIATTLMFVGDLSTGVGTVHFVRDGKWVKLAEMLQSGLKMDAKLTNATTVKLAQTAEKTWNKAKIAELKTAKLEAQIEARDRINADLAALPESDPFAGLF